MKTLIRDTWGISKTVFNNRPKSATITDNDFVVVKVSGSVQDIAAYGSCTVTIDLFAKDVSNLKNGKKLSVMYKKLVDVLPYTNDRYVFEGNPTLLSDVADDYGYHARMIQIKTIIKINN
ncbi:MAG: hypothetical protein WCS15_01330 [Prevotella sp.]